MSLDYKKLRKVLEAMPLKFQDKSIKENAAASEEVGLETKVTRTYDGVGLSNHRQCDWCLERCGVNMTRQEAEAKGAFERHPGCGCEIEYTTEKGTQRQTDWKTNTWTDVQDDDIIEYRRLHGAGDNSPTQLLSLDITNLRNEYVGRSIGAKFQNYDIMDLETGEMYHLAEGEYLRDKEVFAGKGTRVPYEKAYKYVDRYGGKEKDWQHVKGIGVLETPDGNFLAEIHWSQCEGIGKKEMFVKRWLE